MSRHVEAEHGDGVAVFHFTDANLDSVEPSELERDLRKALEQFTEQKIVISFQGVNYITSDDLGVMIRCLQHIRAQGRQLGLADMNDFIRQVFTTTRLDRMFPIHPTVDEAVQGLA